MLRTLTLSLLLTLTFTTAGHTKDSCSTELANLKAELEKVKEELATYKGEEAEAEEEGDPRERLAEYFKSDAEPKILDALWTKDTILKLGAIDDGSSRNGLAQYACLLVGEYGLGKEGIQVQIIDIKELVDKDKWVKLGKATCY